MIGAGIIAGSWTWAAPGLVLLAIGGAAAGSALNVGDGFADDHLHLAAAALRRGELLMRGSMQGRAGYGRIIAEFAHARGRALLAEINEDDSAPRLDGQKIASESEQRKDND